MNPRPNDGSPLQTLFSLVGASVLLCCSFAQQAYSHDEDADSDGYTIADRYEPTPYPDRVVLTWSGDPASSINVTWRTNVETAETVVEYAVAENLLGDLRSEVPGLMQRSGQSEEFESDLGRRAVSLRKADRLEAGDDVRISGRRRRTVH